MLLKFEPAEVFAYNLLQLDSLVELGEKLLRQPSNLLVNRLVVRRCFLGADIRTRLLGRWGIRPQIVRSRASRYLSRPTESTALPAGLCHYQRSYEVQTAREQFALYYDV